MAMLSGRSHEPSYTNHPPRVRPTDAPVSTICPKCVGPAKSPIRNATLGDTSGRSPGPVDMLVH